MDIHLRRNAGNASGTFPLRASGAGGGAGEEASCINSMTGYGRALVQEDGRQITIEIKSVNHRFLDLNLRMPRSFLFLEDEMRKAVARNLARGHVDLFVTYKNLRPDARSVRVDQALLGAYMHSLGELEGLEDDRTLLNMARLPEVLQIEENPEDEEALRALATQALEQAIGDLLEMRRREGEAMRRDLQSRQIALGRIAAEIRALFPGTVERYMQRLRQSVQELLGQQMDEQRLFAEAAIMADRAAIDEELVRLDSHFQQLEKLLDAEEPVGRKLDFLVQELNREFNTISSKSQDMGITRLVLEAKSEIEKLREQVQNVE